MNCRDKIDNASERLSRAQLALNLAKKAGLEATRAELLDLVYAVSEYVDRAAELLAIEEAPQTEEPGREAPVCDHGKSGKVYPMTLSLAKTAP